MTQEEKQILKVDLCARLPYGVKVLYDNSLICQLAGLVKVNGRTCFIAFGVAMPLEIDEIKPYLRPMSSMTDDEKFEIQDLYHQNTQEVFKDPSEIRGYRFYDISVVDWLNFHHFDYRGLIEMGLALEATEGMYN